MTSAAALQRFAEALTPRPYEHAAPPIQRTERQALKAAERAGEALRKAGA
jgi:hypothetical protein